MNDVPKHFEQRPSSMPGGAQRHRRTRAALVALAGITLPIAMAHSAHATGWQYCLASSEEYRRTYIGAAGPEQPGMEAIFQRTLERAGLRFDGVQCPRASDLQTLDEMQSYAIRYNRLRGLDVMSVPAETAR